MDWINDVIKEYLIELPVSNKNLVIDFYLEKIHSSFQLKQEVCLHNFKGKTDIISEINSSYKFTTDKFGNFFYNDLNSIPEILLILKKYDFYNQNALVALKLDYAFRDEYISIDFYSNNEANIRFSIHGMNDFVFSILKKDLKLNFKHIATF